MIRSFTDDSQCKTAIRRRDEMYAFENRFSITFLLKIQSIYATFVYAASEYI